MILFINVFITNERLNHHERFRGWLKNPQRIDVYKYMLASLATIPYWSKIIIYCKLDKEFENQADSLEKYTNNLFHTKKISYHKNRIEYQHEWRKELQEVFDEQDKLVWFLCNDDHIFIDYDLDNIEDAINLLEIQHDKMASFFFSHHPETMKAVAHQNHKMAGNLAFYDGGNVDSIQLVTKKVLSRWFFENEDTNRFMPRPDWRTGFVKTDLTRHYVPLKECCRHFEGYPMVNININHCPPLDIPDGFFEKNIKIAYGDNKSPETGWTWFNPLITNYKTIDPNGVDYRFVPNDIPMFWKDHISTIRINKEIDMESMRLARNEAVWLAINSRPNQPEYKIDQALVMKHASR